MELGFSQVEVAKLFNTDVGLIYMWEKNIVKPSIKKYPIIINFLGYVPFEVDTTTLDGKVKWYRYINGLSQEEMAKLLGINECTVRDYEKGIRTPCNNRKEEILKKNKTYQLKQATIELIFFQLKLGIIASQRS